MFNLNLRPILTLSLLIAPYSALAQTEGDEEQELVENPGSEIGNEDSDFAPGVRLGAARYGGSGCPQGTLSSVLSPDHKSISLLFYGFQVEAGGGNAAQSLKQCTVQIPLQVPAGYRAMIVRTDIRGFNSLPRKGNSSLVIRHDFDGPGAGRKAGLVAKKHFEGPLEKDYSVGARFKRLQKWTKCGGTVTVNLDLRLRANSNNLQELALSTVDTMDGRLKDAVKSHLRWKRCSNDSPGNGQGNGSGRPQQPGHSQTPAHRGSR